MRKGIILYQSKYGSTKKYAQWLEREKGALKGTVVKMPAREDIDLPVEEHLIVELYSK